MLSAHFSSSTPSELGLLCRLLDEFFFGNDNTYISSLLIGFIHGFVSCQKMTAQPGLRFLNPRPLQIRDQSSPQLTLNCRHTRPSTMDSRLLFFLFFPGCGLFYDGPHPPCPTSAISPVHKHPYTKTNFPGIQSRPPHNKFGLLYLAVCLSN